MLQPIAAGEIVYMAPRDAAERENPIFEEIETLTVEVANSYGSIRIISSGSIEGRPVLL
jgi:hypothetical protein